MISKDAYMHMLACVYNYIIVRYLKINDMIIVDLVRSDKPKQKTDGVLRFSPSQDGFKETRSERQFKKIRRRR